jgi:O-methyltransferase
VYYGDPYNLPAALGEFDIAVMGAVLLHCRDPLRIVEQCAKRAKPLIVVDKFHPDLEDAPVCRLAPTPKNFLWHTWSHFSTQFFIQFLAVMGFAATETSTHEQYHQRSVHAFYDRRAAGMKYGFGPLGYVECHSERSEESLISSGAIHK